MMDEPTAGMSPGERRQIVELIQRIRGEHRITVLLTEHDMDVVFSLADRIMVLNYGEVIVIGQPEDGRPGAHPRQREEKNRPERIARRPSLRHAAPL